ncbi:glutamine amidotransferase-related protein [Methylomonas sp. BW4-1]|uniref:CTP synthase C-terminal region-related (seleno)protein n=1 Tax=Methylomonas sp. BW4-1 TaxID=3376685 RepID=UPI004041C59C
MTKFIALLGEYTPTFPPHLATNAAIEHAKAALGLEINADWISTEDIDQTLFQRYAGIWVAPGSPYRNLDKTLAAIRYARESGIPCFGTCGGFQHMILEYARNVLGFKDAQHAEYDSYASDLFISKLACSLAGRQLPLTFEPGSRVADIYGALTATEQYYCNFGINPDYIDVLKSGPLKITAADAEGEIRVIEWSDHPFFIGTLFVPQARSKPEQPHPLVSAFLRAVANL